MQVYPVQPSFTQGEFFELAVQPNRRFSIAIYQQRNDEALTSLSGVIVAGTNDVTSMLVGGKYVFQSAGDSGPVRFDQDWKWPTITIRPHTSALESGAYVAVAYEVDASGKPLSDLGRRCAAHRPVYGSPPDSDSMALVIACPRAPTARLAYIIPTATYQAYNSTGGGCFYRDPIHRSEAAVKVSLRRPGGGLGAQLGEPADPYDTRSPRQQFTHWDAKFVRWLRAEHIACDFFTDVDLHCATYLRLDDYQCVLSVGHHEYWSRRMREHVARFVNGGGNWAVFSGNTCYREVDFGGQSERADIEVMNNLSGRWLEEYSESNLMGLSYDHGGGKYGDWRRYRGGWIRRTRESVGYTVRQADHWVFAGTGLRNGETFGAEDHLVGYEVDGVPPGSSHFNTLADTPKLVGWEMEGMGAMGTFRPKSSDGPAQGLVFNCGTTDWARVLMDPNAESHVIVDRITRNVVRRFLRLELHETSREDLSLAGFASREHRVSDEHAVSTADSVL